MERYIIHGEEAVLGNNRIAYLSSDELRAGKINYFTLKTLVGNAVKAEDTEKFLFDHYRESTSNSKPPVPCDKFIIDEDTAKFLIEHNQFVALYEEPKINIWYCPMDIFMFTEIAL